MTPNNFILLAEDKMPVLHGTHTLLALQKDPGFQRVPRVFLIISINDDNEKKSFSLGAIACFVTSFSMKDCVAAAQKMLTYCQ